MPQLQITQPELLTLTFPAGATMHVRTISPVKAGEELTVAYINLYDPRGTRRTQLQAGKFFACACLRCREPLADSADRFLEV